MTKSLAVISIALLTLGLILNQPSFAQPAPGSAQPAPSAAAAAPAPAAPQPAPSAAAAQPPAAAPSPPAQASTPPAAHGHGVGEATIITIHGKIASVNRAKRMVSLVGPDGNKFTFKVANSANLALVKAGDPFVVRFFESVHVRRKRPGEVLPAVSIKQGITTATPGQTPGGVVHTKRKVVLTVVEVDAKDRTVTVKDPDGAEETVKVGNSRYLERLKAGDDLVVTTREAVAISLDKE
ncbi:MAG TPA: hypothetical protein VGH29_00105 [Candidatus Binataceae bacterium]